MGIVYKAIDTQLDEPVAIKTLPGDVMTRSPEDLERFKREIRLARKITHRNVLRTYDYGEAEGVYFISMELVRGYTLAELLAEAEAKQMALRVAVGIMRRSRAASKWRTNRGSSTATSSRRTCSSTTRAK